MLWYTGSVRLTLWSIVGISGVSLVFGVLADLLLRAGRQLGMQAGSLWRLALAGLSRRRSESVAQILIFGLAIMLILIMVLLRTALLDEWRTQLPEHAPNHFLMNVAPEQVEPLQVDGARPRRSDGRVVSDDTRPDRCGERYCDSANGKRLADRQSSADPNLDSERNLSWTATLPANNTIEAGDWWGARD